jgi:hypothetical protein
MARGLLDGDERFLRQGSGTADYGPSPVVLTAEVATMLDGTPFPPFVWLLPAHLQSGDAAVVWGRILLQCTVE